MKGLIGRLGRVEAASAATASRIKPLTNADRAYLLEAMAADGRLTRDAAGHWQGTPEDPMTTRIAELLTACEERKKRHENPS